MSERCEQCGEAGHPAGARYCFQCGSRLPQPGEQGESSYTPRHLQQVLESPDARDGERKDVSVLIADVAGSLALTAALDPEDLHAVMNGFFAVVNDVVHAQGGQINQYRGDGFMALFGAPRALSDHAKRASNAALEIRAATERYAESVRARFGHPLVLRMGLNTGLVWVGSIGTEVREDYTAEGTTVGVAARMEESAAPGQILVAEETQRRCAPFFEWADLGERPIRGLKERIRVFELLRRGPHADRLGVERERGPTPLAGRGPELEELARAATPGPGVRCVEVTGEAGIGKSRLVFEHLGRLPRATAVLEIQAAEARRSRAFHPWIELLRRWPRDLGRSEAAEAALARFDGREGGEDQRPVHQALRRLIEDLAQERPTVIAIDDAQWLDASSSSVIRELAAHPPAGNLVLLATVRPGGTPPWPRESGAEVIALEHLRPDEAATLAREVLGSLEDVDDLVEIAVLRGGGNALFVEEVARSLLEGSESLRHAARLEVALRREPAQVPHTLHSVVAARIDGLVPASKRALEAAAILGQSFSAELLGDLEAFAPEALPELVGRGLLRPRGREEFEFSHGIVAEVAAGQLVRGRRESLHRRAAECLEKRGLVASADGAARAGAHFDRAGDATRGAPHLIRAGRLYARLHALAEAAVHLQRGLELWRQARKPGNPEETRAALLLATCLNGLDRSSEAAAVLEGVDIDAVGASDVETFAQASIQAGWLRFAEDDDLAGGRALVQRGLDLMDAGNGSHRQRALGLSYLARMLILDGQVEEAVPAARRVVTLSASRSDSTSEILARYNDVQALCQAGRVADARASADSALERVGGREGPLLQATVELTHAWVLLYEGRPEESLTAAGRGSRLADRAAQVALRYQAASLSGYAHLLLEQPRLAHDSFEQMTHFGESWTDLAVHRARGFLEIGELAEAQTLARSALEARLPRLFRVRADSILGLALGLADPGAGDEAERLLGQALSTCDELNLAPARAESHLFLAELLAERGERERARYYTDRARSGFEACGMPLHAERARFRYAG